MRNYLKKRELAYAEGRIVGLTLAISIIEMYLNDKDQSKENESLMRCCLCEVMGSRTRLINQLKEDKNEN